MESRGNLKSLTLPHSQNQKNLREKNEGDLIYLRARSLVPTTYLKIFLTTLRFSTYGFCINRGIKFIEKEISSMEMVK